MKRHAEAEPHLPIIVIALHSLPAAREEHSQLLKSKINTGVSVQDTPNYCKTLWKNTYLTLSIFIL